MARTHSKYKNHLTEKPVKIDKSKDINITFTGILDKINYFEENNQINAIIIDYKTGEVSSTLDDINYGLNMQPSNLYLPSSKRPRDQITPLMDFISKKYSPLKPLIVKMQIKTPKTT